MDRRPCTAVGIAALGWLAASCGPHALTREQARSLIQQSDRCAPRIVQFDLTREELESGAKAGYWNWRREKGSALSYPVFPLTSRGLAVFEGEGRDMVHGRMEFSHPVLTARPKLRAEIVQRRTRQGDRVYLAMGLLAAARGSRGCIGQCAAIRDADTPAGCGHVAR